MSKSVASKTRLKVAVDRSNKLEDELIVSRTSANGDGNAYESMKRALNPKSGGGRRRHGNPSSIVNTRKNHDFVEFHRNKLTITRSPKHEKDSPYLVNG